MDFFSLQTDLSFQCIGSSRSQPSSSKWSNYLIGDIVDANFATQLISETRPTHIIHLAGNSNPKEAAALFQVNLQGTWNLLSACTKLAMPPRVLLVGSAAGFGDMFDDEDSLSGMRTPNPNSLYGLVREQALQVGNFFKTNYQIPVISCRTFNLLGPGLPDKYAPTAIIKRILQSDRQSLMNFQIANGQYVRDFLDIRDACQAWASILLRGSIDRTYSVGSGRATTIQELTETIFSCLNIVGVNFESADLGQPNRSQIARSVADITDLVTDIQWTPSRTLHQSVMDMISHLQQTTNNLTDSN